MSDDPLLADLTEPQRQAVLHTEGPLLILAAAGSGKTRTLTRRIAHMVRSGVRPWQVLALTFTNKAAAEMRARVESLLGEGGARGMVLSTFHSLCARLLRRHAEAAGLAPEFSIYDTDDQMAVMKKVVEALGLSSSNFPPRSMLSAIGGEKNQLRDAAAYGAIANDFYSRTVAKVFAAYEKSLRASQAVDFDDLLVLTAKMLRGKPEVLADCRRRWRYLLIDEYQDTNHAQFVISTLLAGGAVEGGPPGNGDVAPNICVVGDPDQSIYAWRGADISNILDFERLYPSARVITLGENFRSTAPILLAADTLIRKNVRRKHKDLFTKMPGGEPIEVVLCESERHESSLVLDWLRERRKDESPPTPWSRMAILYRNNSLSRVVEDALRAGGVPYVIARGTAFYEREEVRHALAYLRVLANPADDASLSRIVNVPPRGLGETTLSALEAAASSRGVPLLHHMMTPGVADALGARARASVAKFVGLMEGWTGGGTFWADAHAESAPGSLAELVGRVIRESGLEAMYAARAKGTEADEARLENLGELVSSARQFEEEYDAEADPALQSAAAPPMLALLRAFLESVALVADADAADPTLGAVTLMTLHAAKGLEFHALAIIGAEEGLLPSARARATDEAVEEERRLMFVGITRAMRRLLITSARYRTVRGLTERQVPSRFLVEMGVKASEQSDPFGDLDNDDLGEESGPGSHVASGGTRHGTSARFRAGVKVRHPQFGVGTVVSATAGVNARVQVSFQGIGVKTLVLEYARLEPLG
ncbi:MAG: ATP-dependent helicase [Phycisphaerales bacterium]